MKITSFVVHGSRERLSVWDGAIMVSTLPNTWIWNGLWLDERYAVERVFSGQAISGMMGGNGVALE